MGMKTQCLGVHSGSLDKNLVACTRFAGVTGNRAPVRQQPLPAHFQTRSFMHYIIHEIKTIRSTTQTRMLRARGSTT